MARTGLAWLARMDAAGLTSVEQADCLRALEATEAAHTAARARVLAAFHAGDGFREDGHGSAKTWLRWQTRITQNAAATALAWMRRLAAHPAVADALAAGGISPSWARQVCAWTDLLLAHRADADAILLAAAADGAGLSDLAALAEEIRRRTARPDADKDDGFRDRWVSLDVTFGQAGKLAGDLTPQCTAALGAVLDALGKRAGPEDLRTVWQRRHDALEEMCRRLIARRGCRTGPGSRSDPGAHEPGSAPRPGRRGRVWCGGGVGGGVAAAGPGADCDASIVPVVTGHLDHQLLTSSPPNCSAASPAHACPARARAARARAARPGRLIAAGGCGLAGRPAAHHLPRRGGAVGARRAGQLPADPAAR